MKIPKTSVSELPRIAMRHLFSSGPDCCVSARFYSARAASPVPSASHPRGVVASHRTTTVGRLVVPRGSTSGAFWAVLRGMYSQTASFSEPRVRQRPASPKVIRSLLPGLQPKGATPNLALQRTGAAVTPAASCLRLSPTAQRSRQPRRSLSLGSLGVATFSPQDKQ